MTAYADFLATKLLTAPMRGMTTVPELSQRLFKFQREGVDFGLRAGSWAAFYSTGLGKSFMELEWCKHAAIETNGQALILTPLAVARQIESEGKRFGYEVNVVKDDADVRRNAGGVYSISVCNYDRLHLLDPSAFGAIALDEASILKNFTGTTSRALIDAFRGHRFRMVATATPAPNDHTELAQYADFLGVLDRSEMLVRWFINDSSDTKSWRLKGHAVRPFYDWMASWARMAEHPRDLGDDIDGFDLPPFVVTRHRAEEPDKPIGDGLFGGMTSATQVHDIKRQTLEARAVVVKSIVESNPNEPCLIWVDTDYEADSMLAAIPGSVDIRGSYPTEKKEARLLAFISGAQRILIGKPSQMGYGLNLQHCNRMIFAGRSFSYEQWYQAVRRCWRFGQQRTVFVHLVVAEGEDAIGRVIDRKADSHVAMKDEMRGAMARAIGIAANRRVDYDPKWKALTPPWMEERIIKCLDVAQADGRYTAYNGDCVSVVSQLPDESVDLSIYSPPFSNLFVYSDSAADMGNAQNDEEFLEHYRYLLRELYRLTVPGRLTAVHCSDLPLQKWRDGVIGIKDLSGQIIRAHEETGWTLHSRITIWKSPVVEMTRTKALGLLYKQLQKDSTRSRTGMADYLLVFRKEGENPRPVVHTPESFPLDRWQQWASPVWMDIQQTRTLNVEGARESKDERHLCPLQLDVIDRALVMWSNRDDVVLSPFMGIGSEGVRSLKLGRRFVGIELKASYFKQAIDYLAAANSQQSLLDALT